MRTRLRNIGLLAVVFSLAACGGGTNVPPTSGAAAIPNQAGGLQYAPNVTRACAAAVQPDEAACLALIRTDILSDSTPAGYGPSELRSAYNLPSTKDGKRQTVAVVDAYDDPNAASDIAVYRKQFGLPACNTSNPCFEKVNEEGKQSGYPAANSGWAVEESLDVDMVSAICPNCRVVLVEADSSYLSDLGKSVNTAVKIIKANAVSNSYIGYGAHEGGGSRFYNHPGVIITAAGGDEGYKVGEPAGLPTVVAVGGTSLRTDTSTSRGWSETAWAGTGSGCVISRPKPPWQLNKACKWREMNDVAADADPNTGVAVYDTYERGGWSVIGGTSVASPIIASVYALAGNESKMTYAKSLYAKGASLFDVTSGSNGTCKKKVLCNAGPGWDGPTGNGTPNGISAF